MLNLAHFKDDSGPNGTLFFPSGIHSVYNAISLGFKFCFELLCSMGLFCLGSHLRIIFGGEA